MKVFQAKTYVFQFATARGSAFPALLEVQNLASSDEDQTKAYHLFGTMLSRPLGTELVPLRWDAGEAMIFAVREFSVPFGRAYPRAFRYPIRALVSRIDWASSLDQSKLEGLGNARKDWPIPHYIGLEPIRSVYWGLEGWKEGDGLATDGLHASRTEVPLIHYDVRALDDVQIELYMTVNGELSRWVFDGDQWTLAQKYPVAIKGPFLVYKKGKAIVAETNGHWCMIEPLDNAKPEIRPVVARVADEPLVLVEDVETGSNYFQQQGKLYDETGATIWSIPLGTKGNARFKAVVDFVCSRRKR